MTKLNIFVRSAAPTPNLFSPLMRLFQRVSLQKSVLTQSISYFRRFWWIVVVSLSMIGCGITISESYQKWKDNPVIVTFSEKMTRLKHLPFPAVTICPGKLECSSKVSVCDNFPKSSNPWDPEKTFFDSKC